MNFLQLVQRLHSESVRSTALPTTVATTDVRHLRLVNKIKDAWRNLQSERDWKWMRATLDATLTADQQTYSGLELGASNFGRWRKEDDTYNVYSYIDGAPNAIWTLNYWNLDDFRFQFVYRVLGATTPIAWTFDESNNLIVGPKPALAYKLRIEYWKEPVELEEDADSPDMPERFHMALVWRALKDSGLDDAAPEQITKAENNYTEVYDKLLRDQARLPHL